MPFQSKDKKVLSSKGGKFTAALGKLAKARGKGDNPKRGQTGGAVKFGSKIVKPEGSTKGIQATEGQTALNPEQPGKSNKNMQTKGRF